MKARLKISILQDSVFAAHQKVAQMQKIFMHKKVNVYRKESDIAVDIPEFGVIYIEIQAQAVKKEKRGFKRKPARKKK